MRHFRQLANGSCIVLMLCTAIEQPAKAEPKATKPQLMFAGDNWESNAPSSSGERWLALRNDGICSSLVQVEVFVTRAIGEPMRPVTVSIKDKFTPRFLIRNISETGPGTVKTWFDGQLFLTPGMNLFLPQTDTTYAVGINTTDRVATVRQDGSRWEAYDVVLFTNAGKVKQTVAHAFTNGAKTPILLWAGDLDHDGRVDILLDVNTEEAAGSTYHLYLSSHAKKGQIVGLAAELSDPAC